MTTVIEEIAAERRRQIEVEGWDADHDDRHDDGELARAAAAYAYSAARGGMLSESSRTWRRLWPDGWDWRWWKPKDPRRDLVRAGALIVAAIEQLDRAGGGRKPS